MKKQAVRGFIYVQTYASAKNTNRTVKECQQLQKCKDYQNKYQQSQNLKTTGKNTVRNSVNKLNIKIIQNSTEKWRSTKVK